MNDTLLEPIGWSRRALAENVGDSAKIPGATFPGNVSELRMSLRILLHLAGQGRVGPGEIAPMGMTQQGMVAALGFNQGALAGALQRLGRAGVITFDRRHVRGNDLRLKVYQLTDLGSDLVRDLRARRASRAEGEPRGP